MQQLKYQIKYDLITTNNNINFPSYYNERPSTLLSNQLTYDLLDTHSYSSGVLINNSELSIEKLYLIHLYSNNEFEYSIDGGLSSILTLSFMYFNPKSPLNINIKSKLSNVQYLYIN